VCVVSQARVQEKGASHRQRLHENFPPSLECLACMHTYIIHPVFPQGSFLSLMLAHLVCIFLSSCLSLCPSWCLQERLGGVRKQIEQHLRDKDECKRRFDKERLPFDWDLIQVNCQPWNQEPSDSNQLMDCGLWIVACGEATQATIHKATSHNPSTCGLWRVGSLPPLSV
jgi:hypothetical protein